MFLVLGSESVGEGEAKVKLSRFKGLRSGSERNVKYKTKRLLSGSRRTAAYETGVRVLLS